jgi:FMN phosphatase YigB (HAD superfamily)
MRDSANPRRSFSSLLYPAGPLPREILFVGNQLNTDVQGGEAYGIRTAWLSAPEFRSDDETMTLDDVQPTFIIRRPVELLPLLRDIAL